MEGGSSVVYRLASHLALWRLRTAGRLSVITTKLPDRHWGPQRIIARHAAAGGGSKWERRGPAAPCICCASRPPAGSPCSAGAAAAAPPPVSSITLIVLSSEEGTSELKLERLLQMVFGAMVLFVGLEELTNIRNVERLKKELRASYHLIDSFLGDPELIGDLTQCVDCVIPPEGPLLQEALSGFAEAMGTGFVSLIVSGRVVSATEGWWRLGTPEAVLLPWLVGSLPPQAARDYPVYLPHGSPTVPHRLLTLTLLPGLELCLLCGPRPPLSQLDPQLLERWWQPVLDPLRACLPLGPRGLPDGFPLHKDILGLLLLHLELKRCLFTVEPLGDKGPSPEQRRRLLRHFYALVTSTHFPPEPLEKVEDDVSRAQLPRACYLVLGPEELGTGLRLIALQLGLRLLLLLLAPQSPTHGLRSLATHTLHTLSPLL
ncbi:protein fuzzy homolog isoform X1 [Marmota marmota marmota]|uniref:protein fuzzy homolog isoform X1 n=1 Tax=Marmota marmota marmota TaxID=9994 RepID=UPI000762B369|nr:protein fuzzy homolog isoform X1 [Marmota marmota marmota]